MASPLELAVVELQILVREFNKRLGSLERRMGLEPEPFTPRAERVGGTPIHKPLSPPEKVTRTAETRMDPYEVAAPQKAVPPVPKESLVESLPETVMDDDEIPFAEPPADVPSLLDVSLDAPAVKAVEPAVTLADASVAAGAAQAAAPSSPATPSNEIPLRPPVAPAPPKPPAAKVIQFLQEYQAQRQPPRNYGRELEMTLGTWVSSWLAALSIMGAILFFLKLAIDRGDLFMSPQVRVGMALIAGVGMIAHGYWCHLRGMRALAGGLTAAGVATLMVAVFCANVAFDPAVLSQREAFIVIPFVSMVGLLLAYQLSSPVLVAIAMAGLYVSPLVLTHVMNHPLIFLCYLFAVTAASLILGGKFRAWEGLRLMGFVLAWIWLAAWSGTDDAKVHALMGFAFVCAFFALFLGDMCLRLTGAMRADPSQSPRLMAQTLYHDSVASIFSAVNCAAALGLCCQLFDVGHLPGNWAFALALAAVMGGLSRLIRSEAFTVSAVFQSFALLAIGACLALYGSHVTGAFAILAILFAIYAAVYNSQVARGWMFAFLTLGTARIFAFDSVDPELQQQIGSVGGNPITPWMLMAWTGALLALVLGWLARPSSRRRTDATTELVGAAWATIACVVLSTLLVLVVNVRTLSPGGSFTLGAVIWILALIALMRIRSLAEIGTALETVATVLLMLLCLKWFIFDGVAGEGLVPPAPAKLPFYNLFAANAVLLAGALLLLRPLRDVPATGRRFMGWWLFGLGFVLLNMETLRGIERFMTGPIAGIGSPGLVQNVALTGLWSVIALAMLGVGFLFKAPAIRYVALLLFAVTIGKIVLVDMANVETILRVFSFLLLGIVLFIVSYLYHRSPQNGVPVAGAQGLK